MPKKEDLNKLQTEHEKFMTILTNFALAEIKTYTNNLDNSLKEHNYKFPEALQKSINKAYFNYVNNLRTRAGLPPITHSTKKEREYIKNISNSTITKKENRANKKAVVEGKVKP